MDSTVTGFNVGINAGKSAGQTVFHVHVHLIPRRDGDVIDPKGGVRLVGYFIGDIVIHFALQLPFMLEFALRSIS